jgi:predicted secreted protein
MAWTTILAIYFIIWWTVLFAVLPFGITSQHETGAVSPGTDPGAPVMTGFKNKAIWTTIVATLIFVAFYVLYVTRVVTLDDLGTLWGLLGQPRS